MRDDIKRTLKQLNKRPIAYYPAYADIAGSVTAGVLLSQVLYWWAEMDEDIFYKTDQDFAQELKMGFKEFRGAKKRLRELKLVEMQVRGVPARTYYTVKIKKIQKELAKLPVQSSLPKMGKLVCLKRPNWNGQNRQTITKTTTEITQRQQHQNVVALEGKKLQKLAGQYFDGYKFTLTKKREWQNLLSNYPGEALVEALKRSLEAKSNGGIKKDLVRFLGGVCRNVEQEPEQEEKRQEAVFEAQLETAKKRVSALEAEGLGPEEITLDIKSKFGEKIWAKIKEEIKCFT